MSGDGSTLKARISALVETVMNSRPVRVVLHYTGKRGPILASGLAFQAIFAVFAGLWIGFSVAGLVLTSNIGLRDSVIRVLAQSVPGLIETETEEGIIDPTTLLEAGVFGWTGAIAIIVLLFSALNWLASAREATRSIFDLPNLERNPVLLKLGDLGLAAGFGLALVISTVLSVSGTVALEAVLAWLDIRNSTTSTIVGRGSTLLVMFVLDAVVLAVLYRVLAGVRIPLPRLRQGALFGAIGLGVLKVAGGSLLGGASNNPLLAGFAVLLGLLIWFNLACQVVLAAAAWIAVGVADDGIVLDEKYAQKQLDAARALVKAHEEPPREPIGFWRRVRQRLRR